MQKTKRAKLEAKGWKVGSVQQFLGLSEEEAANVELRLALSRALRQWRNKNRLTQAELAKRLKSSQSRVAKMETGDPSVSLDLLIRSLLSLGASPSRVGEDHLPAPARFCGLTPGKRLLGILKHHNRYCACLAPKVLGHRRREQPGC